MPRPPRRAPWAAAQIPVFLRAFVAIFWFAVHIYIASKAIGAILAVALPGYRDLGRVHVLGMGADVLVAFVICRLVHAHIVRHGVETVRRFESWSSASASAPPVYVGGSLLSRRTPARRPARR